jgi:hypothetical protein
VYVNSFSILTQVNRCLVTNRVRCVLSNPSSVIIYNNLTHLGLSWQKFLVCPYLWQFAHWAMFLLYLGGSNFILHCYMYSTLNISLLFEAGFSSTKNMESGSSVLYCLMFQIFVTECPNVSISTLYSGLME